MVEPLSPISRTIQVLNRHLHPWELISSLRLPYRLLDRVTSSHHRLLDRIAAKISYNHIIYPDGIFCDGWGDPTIFTKFIEEFNDDRVFDIPRISDVQWSAKRRGFRSKYIVREGQFATSLNDSSLLPIESRQCHFQMILPSSWYDDDDKCSMQSDCEIPKGNWNRPIVVLLPGTGDQGYGHRRAAAAIPLAKQGIGSIIMEGPYYGKRKPPNQAGCKLRKVSDLPILGRATIEETRSVLQMLRDEYSYKCLTVAGGSMGGLHSAMVASLVRFPVGVSAWMAPQSAVSVFTEGLLSNACNWESLSTDSKARVIDKIITESAECNVDKDDPFFDTKARLGRFLTVTDIRNFPVPVAPEAAIVAIASDDEYIGTIDKQWMNLADTWKGVDVQALNAGHVSGLLFERRLFQESIRKVSKILQENYAEPEQHSETYTPQKDSLEVY